MANVKTWNEKAYDLGVQDGKKGTFIPGLIRSRTNSLDVIHEIYERGYKWGYEHRNNTPLIIEPRTMLKKQVFVSSEVHM